MIPEPGLICMAVAIVWAPIALLGDWFGYFKTLPPQEAELAKAAHGVGVIVCGWYATDFAWIIPVDYRTYFYLGYAALVCLGVFWVLIGSSRAQIYGDRRLLTRAVMKIAVGVAAFYGWRAYSNRWWWGWWIDPAVPPIYLWCWATGITKLVICSRRLPRPPRGAEDDPYGKAVFADRGNGLRGGRK